MRSFIHIRTSKFPILPGEREEIVNPGTYGKSFAQYVQAQLRSRGYRSPCVCGEDWGWWVEVALPSAAIGLCCYRPSEDDGETDFVCVPSALSPRIWSWRRFRFVDISRELDTLVEDLKAIFASDPDIRLVGVTDDFPL